MYCLLKKFFLSFIEDLPKEQLHCWVQSRPYLSRSQEFWQWIPFHPGGHKHCPVWGSQRPPFLQGHGLEQSVPQFPSEKKNSK